MRAFSLLITSSRRSSPLCAVSRQRSSQATGLSADVGRVFDALADLETRTGQPHSLELRSNGRFVLRLTEHLDSAHQTFDGDAPLVDCFYRSDTKKALMPFRHTTARRGPTGASETRRAYAQSSTRSEKGAVALLDLTQRPREDLHAASFVQSRFPHLELEVVHTSGSDVNGARTHTHSVSLRRRATNDELTADEEDALERFRGEAEGHGFNKTLSRAMRAACAVMGLTYKTGTAVDGSSGSTRRDQSVLGLFMAQLRMHAPSASLCVKLVPPTKSLGNSDSGSVPDPCAEVVVEVRCEGRVLADRRGTLQEVLPQLLEAVRAACEMIVPTAAQQLSRDVASRRVVVVLPEQNVNAKKTLCELLAYHYGVAEDQLSLPVTGTASGLFTCSMRLALNLENWLPCHGERELTVVTKAVTATSKKKASETLCATVLQELFPDIFADQLAPHPEFDALLGHAKAGEQGLLAPPVAQGLRKQLTWATEGSGQAWTCTTRQLEEGHEYPELAVSVHRRVWCAETQVIEKKTMIDTSQSQPSTRSFVAFDSRKSKAEQKSYALALSVCFPTQCRAAVAHAISASLLSPDGTLPPYAGVAALPSEQDFHDAVQLDSNMCVLQPRSLPFAALLSPGKVDTSEVSSGTSPLSMLEACEQCLGRSSPSHDEQAVVPRLWLIDVTFDEESQRHVATGRLSVPCPSECVPDAADEPLFRVDHWSRWAARLAVCRACVRFTRDTAANTHLSEAVSMLPLSLSHTNPVEQVVYAVRQLYGAGVILHAYAEGEDATERSDRKDASSRACVVELWGVEHTGTASPPAAATPLSEASLENMKASSLSRHTALLARATGHSLFGATLKCCRLIMAHHVRPAQEVFPRTVLHEGTVGITSWCEGGTAVLPGLLAKVRDDVARSATSALAAAADATPTPFSSVVEIGVDCGGGVTRVVFKVRSDTATVTLETVTDSDLLSALDELTRRICVELGVQDCPSAARHAPMVNTFVEALKSTVQTRLGLPLTVDTCREGGEWHCEISLNLGEDVLCSLARAKAARQSDACELAALHILRSIGVQPDRDLSVVGRSAVPVETLGEAVKTNVLFRRTV